MTRVTDITWLDRIGLPVFVSVRPDAQEGSLCVNAGKGLHPDEALIGAIMEAVEFALAEYGRATAVSTVWATAHDLLDGRRTAVLDLCPRMGVTFDLARPMFCAEAEEIVGGKSYLVPAELVFMPAPPESLANLCFGSNTNGLASGTTRQEAVAHGLAEVIERDIRSFQRVLDDAWAVRITTLPEEAALLAREIHAADLELYLTYQPNPFEMPYFAAVIAEPSQKHPAYLNAGYGCHPDASIAAVRAIAEAVQTRLQMIHGGRDDFIEYYEGFARFTDEQLNMITRRHLQLLRRPAVVKDFGDLPGASRVVPDVATCMDMMIDALAANGMKEICVVPYTEAGDPVQVCRVIVPQCELYFEGKTGRVGRRLADFASRTQATVARTAGSGVSR
ncbi:YcaO-like family protein [Nonomuraea angiospora]|uniref:Ribosomal protein S12 methylthiotransferase accessory factor n=1 Tax=Nonomuraea angiospora TaxID=46172 RepID=A0ABR9LPF0_9ACTN|nr:YcaO-like family protein [Nonomuraea angiospora]MBE1582300.1 ribosomal protein S12 methylthiotransferase accessory factor [Nonomuraea angiospora]